MSESDFNNVLPDSVRDIQHYFIRFRIGTVETVANHCLKGDLPAARSALRRLCGKERKGYVISRPLLGKKVYYQLTAKAVREFGLPEEFANPLGPQALPRAYGVALFCCLGPKKRLLFTRKEFAKHFFDLLEEGVPFNDYFIEDTGEQNILRRILVDLGGDSERFMRKVLGIGGTIANSKKGLVLLHAGAIGFTIITSSDSKRRALETAWESVCPSLQCTFAVHPELLAVLPNFYE